MKTRPYSRSLNSRVPVSTAGNPSPEEASNAGPVGLNKQHEARLITSLGGVLRLDAVRRRQPLQPLRGLRESNAA